MTGRTELLTDADGNVYQSVKIGNQEWTIDNFRTTKYIDGTEIPIIINNADWADSKAPGYCRYKNDAATYTTVLYNWYAVNSKKFAPDGWHVPSERDWTILINYLIVNGYNWDGTTSDNKIAKSLAAQTDWAASSNPGAIGNNLTINNTSGFSAIPSGFRSGNGVFCSVGYFGNWWSSSENGLKYAYIHSLGYDSKYLDMYDHYFKCCGFSVKLLKDN